MPSISAVIITKNEAHHIETCLQRLDWVNEIIVLDSGSSDSTVEICKRYTPHVFETDWPGFGAQKNRAIEKATGDWVLSIDADEIVSSELKQEILQAISDTRINGFKIPRLSSYCGQPIYHSGWWPDHVSRLFRRGKGKFSDHIVHEHLAIDGITEKLEHPIIHNSFENLDQVLDKVNHYSSLGAKQLYSEGKHSSLTKAIFKGIWSFIRTYLLKRGFLDGSKGLMLAISNAEGTYYKYLKLALMYEESQHKDAKS